jgi:hypothetical protein
MIFQLPLQLEFTPLLGLKPCHKCDVISVVTEFMVDATGVQALPCACDVINVVTEFMVDVAGVQALPCACDVISVVTEFMVDATGVEALPYMLPNTLPLGGPFAYDCYH